MPNNFLITLGGRFLGLFAACFLCATALAKPEYFVESMKYGAKDCLFCHVNAAGGHGLTERGQWLVDQKNDRGVEAVDIAWLESREKVESSDAGAAIDAEVDTPSTLEGATKKGIPLDTEKRPFDFSTSFGEWPAYGGDVEATKYSPLNQITRENLDQLKIAWVWESKHDSGAMFNRRKAADSFKGTPLMAGGRLFLRDRYSAVNAINPATGEELWMYDPGSKSGPRPTMFGFSSRGLAYHRDETGERVFLLTSRGWLIALDAATGIPIKGFGNEGKVDLTQGLRRPLDRNNISWSNAPNVCGDVVVIGSQTSDGSHSRNRRRGAEQALANMPLGDVRGFNVHTGKQAWVFKTIPQEGEFGNDTWGNDSWKWMGNTNVWSTTSCDPQLGHAYLPVTAPTNHLYGANRPGDNLFSTSTVAVDNKTGERVWHFQTVHHDIWDYDLPAAPVVADIVFDGKPRKVVAQVTKVGYLFVFDRVTGKPLWEVKEVKVPQSDLEGEVPSATQPQPTWPKPFARQGMREEDLLNLTPELERQTKAVTSKFDLGAMYASASEKGTFISPGVGGGANWGGAAFDKLNRQLFVASREQPMVLRATRVPGDRMGFKYATWFEVPTVAGLPPVNPPWSKITAYDLDTGDILWAVANGAGPTNHPLLRGKEWPDLGAVGAAPGLLVTPSAIFYGHLGRNGGSDLRAMDKDTGKVLWRHTLQGAIFDAPPMTYMVHGKQHIVIGTGHSGQPVRLVAFSL